MKSQSYMTRALQARDPRFARILGMLGYADQGEPPLPVAAADIAQLRADYEELFGKKPFMGWDAAALTAKIDEKLKEG